ncbi:hypothetical protein C488_09634 [Natrinema pellirubrum DSM 15624]|uniref:Small CPxCG-related zinc finger protein n=2 Tax=Natrinema pellirubrum (strain DSM 15624 / CIP 106293 / JCM 10476 / NCIMB 786 / 157) TaxID=797303 RepID=L9YQD2_NATP1|nr:hypothetical protein C488_09634 [Natrinema pellirubrum DSM 15624]
MYGRFEGRHISMSERESAAVDRGDSPVNWRQTGSGVTLYEEGNADAWIHAEFEAGIDPEHRLFMICDECGAVFAQRSKPGNGTVCGDCGTAFDHAPRG